MIYIVGGLPGAGKTTYSKELAAKTHGIVFSTDVWMSDLYWMDKKPGEDLNWALERILRCETRMIKTASQLAERNFSAVLDVGFVNRVYRDKTYEKLAKYNLDFEIHFLEVDKDVRWQRVQKRNREKGETFSLEVTRDMFDFMEDHFNPLTSEETDKKILFV